MKTFRKTILRLAMVAGAVAASSGCSNSQGPAAGRPKGELSAQRPSYSDQASRILAEHTLAQIGQQDEDYRLGPEDVIEISIFEWELSEKGKTVPVRIGQTGTICLPMVGELQAAGRTVWELKKEIEDRLREGGYIRRPQVSIIIKGFHSKKIAVVGAVRKPGVYVIERNVTTLLDILSLAGGMTDQAGQTLYVVRREKRNSSAETTADRSAATALQATSRRTRPTTITIDLHELMERCNLSLNMVLQGGDIVSVPQAERFFVYGYVNKPGAFNLAKPTTVLEAVAIAQGVDHDRGSAEYCVLKRRGQDGSEERIAINLEAIRKGKKPNLYLQADDIIDVRQTWLKGLGIGIGKIFGGVGMGLGYSLN